MDVPNPPLLGSDNLTNWLRRIRDAVLARTVVSGRGYRVKQTTVGTILEIDPPSGFRLYGPYVFQSMAADYITVRSWNYTTMTSGDTDIYIAKPPSLRHSVISEIISGSTVNYTLHSLTAQSRHAVVVGANPAREEDQVITPRYLTQQTLTGSVIIPGSIIYAHSAQTGLLGPTSQPIGLLDANVDAREWTESAD